MAGAAKAFPVELQLFVSHIQSTYVSVYGSCTVVEHGSAMEVGRQSSCIVHAHWHLFPFATQLKDWLNVDGLQEPRVLASAYEIENSQEAAPYLFYWDQDEILLYEKVKLPLRQYARSLVGRQFGITPAEWDWALIIRKDLFHQTYSDVQELQW
jgi:hypothetical protein